MAKPTNRPAEKAPAFQFYPRDFLASLDVQMMSAEEVGAYILLLANSWIANEQCFLKNEKKTLAFIARLSEKKWQEISPKILKKFKKKGDKIYNERLFLERQKQIEFSKKQAKNGARGGRPRTQNPEEPKPKPKKPKPLPKESHSKAKKSSAGCRLQAASALASSSSMAKPKPMQKFLKNFEKLVSENELSDRGYLDKIIEQIPRCRKIDILKIKKKAEKIQNCVYGKKFNLAGVIFREIAGLVNDSQMEIRREI